MASSKLPVKYVMISQSLAEFVKKYPGMVWCNPRLEQRQDGQPRPKVQFYQDSDDVCEEIYRFLRVLPKDAKIALHFQGYGPEVGTAVVQVGNVYWTSDNYPRLDFQHPEGFDKLIQCKFWGAFILAIALVMPESECFFQADPNAAIFMSLAGKFVQLIEYSYEYKVELVIKSEMVGVGGVNREEKVIESISLGNLEIEGTEPRDFAWLQITFDFLSDIGRFNFRIMKVDDVNKVVYIYAPNLKNAKILKTRCSIRV